MSADEPRHVIEIERLLNVVGQNLALHRDLDLRMRRDEVLTLVGGSGSVKTQLLRVILGLKRPAAGTVRVFGVSWDDPKWKRVRDARRRMGLLFQNGALLTVRSYSMNQHVGDPMSERIGEVSRLPDPRLEQYYKLEDFRRLGPSQAFVLLDEHEDSINDGFFFIGGPESWSLGFADYPAIRHRRGANFTFADGHTERHGWRDKRTIRPVTRTGLFAPPQPNSPDVAWLHDHATAFK